MNKNVMIKMKNIQFMNEDKSELELTTKGEYKKNGDEYLISYEDSGATGFEGSKTSVMVRGNSFASILRDGKSNSNLIVEKGKKHHCHYVTPYGEMMVGIYTHEIKNELSEHGGKLYMKYTVDINSSYISDNEIYMDIKVIEN